MTEIEELLGADYCEHRILQGGHIGVSRAVSALKPYHQMEELDRTGSNPGLKISIFKSQK